jgi:hypothetical protein
MTQPEALRLANRLDLYAAGDKHQRDIEEAAAELRRLHELNQELLAALNWISTVNAMDYEYQAIARAAIAKGETK